MGVGVNSFSPTYLSRLPVPPRLVRLLTALAEFKGKQTLWTQTKPEVLRQLLKVAVIESVESSSRMERVEVGPQTFRHIVLKAGEPEAESRSQTELAGYRDALTLIHENAADMPPTENVLRQLHGRLMGYTAAGGGDYKSAPNDIVEQDGHGGVARIRFRTVSPALTGTAMAELHEGLARALAEDEIEPLLLVPLYVHDLLCIHPFADGNGRMARLMTVLLLHRLGYEIGRYISLERIIEATKDTYYDSLAASDRHWTDGRHDHVPFTEYLLGVVLAAYRQLEENTRIDLDHGARARMVERAIQSLPADFRLADVEERCPLVSRDTIRSAMAKLQHDGVITCLGRGRAARWQRLK